MDAGKRDEGSAEGSHGAGDAGTRLLSTLLTEMDGLEHATGAVSACVDDTQTVIVSVPCQHSVVCSVLAEQ